MTVICFPGVVQEHDAALVSSTSDGVVDTAMGRIRLSVFREIQLAENAWRMLQSIAAGVPEQSYEWAKAWTRCVSQVSGIEAAIVCGRSETGEVQFVWPFEVVTLKGLRCLQWISQAHANHNMGLNRLAFSRAATAADVKALLCRAAELIGDVSAAHFMNQPAEWNGIANPLRLLAHRPSANQGYMLLLDSDFDTLFRNRFSGKSRNTLARKARKLDRLGMVEFGWASSDEERSELLDLFFQQISSQFARDGLHNPFADTGHRAFYHYLACNSFDGKASLETAYLKVDGYPVAISSGVFYADTFSLLLTSLNDGPASKHSPGTLLLHYQIEEACRRGLHFFDMGAGDARYKSQWCDIDLPHFDSAIAFEERGYLMTLPLIAGAALKRAIKTHPELWAMAETVRKSVFGHGEHPGFSSEVKS